MSIIWVISNLLFIDFYTDIAHFLDMGSLIIFITCYLLFIFYGKNRALIASLGALFLVFFGSVSLYEALEMVHWNVVALFVGTLLLAELFVLSRVPAVLAEWLVDLMPTGRLAILSICALASILSMAVENVAVVLLVAPVAISLCERIKISPIDPLIYLAIFSNIQGTATLIGDPPSMIMGGYFKMTFNDFFVFHNKLSIFFIVQAGAMVGLLWLYWALRHHKERVKLLRIESPKSLVPSLLLIFFIFILAISSSFDPEFKWLAGFVAMGLALIGLVWNYFGPCWVSTKKLIQTLDFETSIFLAALFILVGSLQNAGWIDSLSFWISEHIAFNLFETFLFLLISSTVASAFIDNVPFLLAMLPLVQGLAQRMDFPVYLLAFSLLIASCLGGNITPIGASTNIVTVGLLKKRGYQVNFSYYVKKTLPITLVSLTVSAIVLWLIWS